MRLALFCLSVLLVAAPAVARDRDKGGAADTPQQPPLPMIVAEPVAMMIAAFDKDGDGRVTRAEFNTGLRHSFDAIDTDHKGSLSYVAFGDWAEKWMGDRNALPSPFEVDRNGDGKISFDELATRFDLFFTRFDANHDDVLVRSELVSVRQMNTAPANGRAGGKGKHRGDHDGRAGE